LSFGAFALDALDALGVADELGEAELLDAGSIVPAIVTL
jgi:hypothetical protein